jgi:hypothetical protein
MIDPQPAMPFRFTESGTDQMLLQAWLVAKNLNHHGHIHIADQSVD